MRLLVDANLSPHIAARLRAAGHDAVHVGDCDLLTATDPQIIQAARHAQRTIVSGDADFSMLLATGGADQPSFILLRSADHLTPDQQADLLLDVLATADRDLRDGAIVTVSRGHVRVRALPIRRRS